DVAAGLDRRRRGGLVRLRNRDGGGRRGVVSLAGAVRAHVRGARLVRAPDDGRHSRASRPPPRPGAEARDRGDAPIEPADAPLPARGDRGPGGGRPAAAATARTAGAAAARRPPPRPAPPPDAAGPAADVLRAAARWQRADPRGARALP